MLSKVALIALALSFLTVAGARAGTGCTLEQKAELPVTMIGPRPVVPAAINGQPVFLAIDSGAFYSLISPTVAMRMGLQLDELARRVNIVGVGGRIDAEITTVRSLTVGALHVPDIDFLTGAPALFDDKIVGALGQNFLSLYDVEYDFANGVMRLFRSKGDCHRVPPVYWSKTYGAMDVAYPTFERPNLIGEVAINGVKFRATFDTGSPNSIMTLKTAMRLGLTPTSPGVVAAGATWGGGPHQLDAWEAPITSFGLGGETIGRTRLRMADLDLNNESDMLVGADFFLSHRVYVANSQHRLYFTYNGGLVFARVAAGPAAVQAAQATPAQTPRSPEPADAAGFVRRAAASLARSDYPRAVADLSRAIALEPTAARHHRDRALAHIANHEPGPAMADLDQALTLKPDDAPSLQLRGGLDLQAGDDARAKADFDGFLAGSGADPMARLAVADAYMVAHRYETAIGHLDRWIAEHPRHDQFAAALDARCEARAEWGRDLDKALADCEAALRRQPRTGAFLDSRGLVRLRLGQADAAIADLNQVLKVQPKDAWGLYVRGLAERAKGQAPAADADIAAALALDATLAARARQYGLVPADAAAVLAKPAV